MSVGTVDYSIVLYGFRAPVIVVRPIKVFLFLSFFLIFVVVVEIIEENEEQE